MVEPSAFLAQQARQGPLAVFAVICHITDVIQIQHPYARQTDRCATYRHFPCQILRLQVIRPAGAEQSEEQKHTQVAQAHIAVTMLAQRVFDGTDDGKRAKSQEDQCNGDW